MTTTDDPRHDQFLRLFTTNEPALRSFVRSLVPTVNDADDVMQEVAIVLWKKFDEFDEGEEFRRWAFGVAKIKVLSWRRDRGRDRHVFGESVTDLLATDAAKQTDGLGKQREALKHCLEKLPAKQRQLVDSAYESDTRIEDLATRLGKTAMTLYKRLHRIRIKLISCTQRLLAQEDWA